MKVLATALLLLAAPTVDDGRFNCPPIKGDISFDNEASASAWPSHIDKLIPSLVIVDFRCRIDNEGAFVDCIFAAREELTERQQEIVQRGMRRIMAATKAAVPNQPCVASKVTLRFGNPDGASIPTPDEPAAESEVPD